MSSIFKNFSKLIYPARCPFCDKIIADDKLMCDSCKDKVIYEEPLKSVLENSFCVSPFPYQGIYRDAILNLKFKKRQRNAYCLSLYIVQAVRQCYENEHIDFITSVPLSKRQMRKRGFNHAEALARSVSEISGIPYRESLVKIRDNKVQHTLNRIERAKNVKGVYKIADTKITGNKILLVDDIVTTGCTLAECCKVLKKSKNKVICCTFCSTLLY